MRTRWKLIITAAVVSGVFAAAVLYNSFSDPDIFDSLNDADLFVQSVSMRLVEENINNYESALITLARNGNAAERARALILLAAAVKNSEINELLPQALVDEDEEIRAAAAFTAGEIQAFGLRKYLQKLTGDSCIECAAIADLALSKLERGYNNPIGIPFPLYATVYEDFTPAEYRGVLIPGCESRFFVKLIRYLDANTNLDFSGVSPENIGFGRGWSSGFNAQTGFISIGNTSETDFAVIASHLLHETAVINLGRHENYGRLSINYSYVHDLAVLTELAYTKLTGTSLEYLWHQIQTIKSKSTRYEAEKWFTVIARYRYGHPINEIITSSATVYKPSAGNVYPNFLLQIKIDKNLIPVQLSITLRDYPF
ncbi:MAG: hypothetical protein ACYS8W_10530 [Planctomycetota bacterium]|jgi:hypothetical protein